MQVVIEKKQNGSVAIELDGEAARAMVASIVFASRFHEGIAPLAEMVKVGLRNEAVPAGRRTTCQ